jgi:hypothetical protein
LAEVWNGVSWKIRATPNPAGASNSYFQGVSCMSATSCIAVGYSEDTLGDSVALAEVWNGAKWTIKATPDPIATNNSYLFSVSCASSTTCTAVGDFYITAAGVYGALSEAWNGATWTIQKTPNPAGSSDGLDGVSCTSAISCVAVGYSVVTSSNGALVEVWNGATWAIQKTPRPASGSDTLSGVSCTSSTTCTAVGNRGAGTLAEAMNGTIWSVQKTPNPAGATLSYLNSVWCPTAVTCSAVGFSGNSSSVDVALAEAN